MTFDFARLKVSSANRMNHKNYMRSNMFKYSSKIHTIKTVYIYIYIYIYQKNHYVI